MDFALASYVYKMYMCEDDVADWFADELKDMHAAFIISRDQSLKTALMEKRGVDVRKLMALQTQRGDDRQLVFSRDRVFETWSTSTKSAHAPESSMTFPNVPYEEHKTGGRRPTSRPRPPARFFAAAGIAATRRTSRRETPTASASLEIPVAGDRASRARRRRVDGC